MNSYSSPKVVGLNPGRILHKSMVEAEDTGIKIAEATGTEKWFVLWLCHVGVQDS